MVNQQGPQKSFGKETITRITDINGDIVLEIGLREYIVKHSDGSRTVRRISETIQLVDGMAWNPSMTKVSVGVCQQCRRKSFFRPKTHGLVAMHIAKKCIDGCGQLLCMKHARRGRDKEWRCLKHHRVHMLKSLFRPIFLEKEED